MINLFDSEFYLIEEQACIQSFKYTYILIYPLSQKKNKGSCAIPYHKRSSTNFFVSAFLAVFKLTFIVLKVTDFLSWQGCRVSFLTIYGNIK